MHTIYRSNGDVERIPALAAYEVGGPRAAAVEPDRPAGPAVAAEASKPLAFVPLRPSELAALLCVPASRVHSWTSQGISGGLTLKSHRVPATGRGFRGKWAMRIHREDWLTFVREALQADRWGRLQGQTLVALRRAFTWPTAALLLAVLCGCAQPKYEHKTVYQAAEEVRPAEVVDGPY